MELKVPDLRDTAYNIGAGMVDLRERIQDSMVELEKLSMNHLHAIRLYIQGFKPSQIDRMCGFTGGWFSRFIVCDLAQKKVLELTRELDSGMIESINLSKKIFQDSAPAIARNLVNLSFEADKDGDKINASVNALKFAQEGISEEQARPTAIKIMIGDKQIDIFDSMPKALPEECLEEGGNEEGENGDVEAEKVEGAIK